MKKKLKPIAVELSIQKCPLLACSEYKLLKIGYGYGQCRLQLLHVDMKILKALKGLSDTAGLCITVI